MLDVMIFLLSITLLLNTNLIYYGYSMQTGGCLSVKKCQTFARHITCKLTLFDSESITSQLNSFELLSELNTSSSNPLANGKHVTPHKCQRLTYSQVLCTSKRLSHVNNAQLSVGKRLLLSRTYASKAHHIGRRPQISVSPNFISSNPSNLLKLALEMISSNKDNRLSATKTEENSLDNKLKCVFSDNIIHERANESSDITKVDTSKRELDLSIPVPPNHKDRPVAFTDNLGGHKNFRIVPNSYSVFKNLSVPDIDDSNEDVDPSKKNKGTRKRLVNEKCDGLYSKPGHNNNNVFSKSIYKAKAQTPTTMKNDKTLYSNPYKPSGSGSDLSLSNSEFPVDFT